MKYLPTCNWVPGFVPFDFKIFSFYTYRQSASRLLKVSLLNFLINTTIAQSSNVQPSNIDYIDPTIGNVGQLLEPTRPTVQLPNQLIRFTPQRKDYLDDQVSSFQLTIVSHRLGQVFSIQLAVGTISNKSWQARMPYDHNLEINKPWQYATYLIDDGITVDYTAGKKTGFYQFLFPAEKSKSILLGVYNKGNASFNFLSVKEITGVEVYHGDIKVFMYGMFSIAGTPGIVENNQLHDGTQTEGENARAYITFPASTTQVDFKYTISYISAEKAKINYEKEIADKSFQSVVDAGKMAWSAVMSQINLEGGTKGQKRSFYAALYRCYERMVNISENSSYYSGFDKKIHKDARPFYVDNWAWDTYLALHPLRTILNPSVEEDMLHSYVRMYAQSGWMPTFPVLFGDHGCMNGFHSSIIFLDAYRKGLKNFDIEKAYEGMTLAKWRKNNAG
jgi:predicted alpha-1,2-mannosidase